MMTPAAYVYVLGDKEGVGISKIGVARLPWKRAEKLRKFSRYTMTLRWAYPYEDKGAAFVVGRLVKRAMRSHRLSGTEYFSAFPSRLMEEVRKAQAAYAADPGTTTKRRSVLAVSKVKK